MTLRFNTRYKICKLHKTDIWARIFITRKKIKFKNLLKPRQRTYISIGNFKGDLTKRKKSYRKRKTRYGKNLAVKQKLIKYYGGLKEYQFKQYLAKNKKFKKNVLRNTIHNIETRLDVALLRSNLVKSIFDSRFYIVHKKILVNNKIINKPGSIIYPGDIISTETPIRFWRRIKRTRFVWGYSSKHLYVNWKTLKTSLYKIPYITDLIHPFKIKSRKILEFYKI